MASDDSSTSQKPLGWGQQKAVILKTFCPKSGSLATGQWHDRVLKEQLREEDFLKNQDNVHSSEKKNCHCLQTLKHFHHHDSRCKNCQEQYIISKFRESGEISVHNLYARDRDKNRYWMHVIFRPSANTALKTGAGVCHGNHCAGSGMFQGAQLSVPSTNAGSSPGQSAFKMDRGGVSHHLVLSNFATGNLNLKWHN